MGSGAEEKGNRNDREQKNDKAIDCRGNEDSVENIHIRKVFSQFSAAQLSDIVIISIIVIITLMTYHDVKFMLSPILNYRGKPVDAILAAFKGLVIGGVMHEFM